MLAELFYLIYLGPAELLIFVLIGLIPLALLIWITRNVSDKK